MYTLHEETDADGYAVASLRDGNTSFCQVTAPSYDPTNPTAARLALAKQLAYNMAHDRMTQIVLDLKQIPQLFSDLLRIQLQIEINVAAKNTIVWQEAINVLSDGKVTQ